MHVYTKFHVYSFGSSVLCVIVLKKHSLSRQVFILTVCYYITDLSLTSNMCTLLFPCYSIAQSHIFIQFPVWYIHAQLNHSLW